MASKCSKAIIRALLQGSAMLTAPRWSPGNALGPLLVAGKCSKGPAMAPEVLQRDSTRRIEVP